MEKILVKIDQSKWLAVISVELVSIWALAALAVMVQDAKLMCLAVEPMGLHCNCLDCIGYAVHSVNTFFEIFGRHKKCLLRENIIRWFTFGGA